MIPNLWKKYWQDQKTKYIAFIGKDNIVFPHNNFSSNFDGVE